MCKYRSVWRYVCISAVPVEAKRGFQKPWSWSYTRLCAACGSGGLISGTVQGKWCALELYIISPAMEATFKSFTHSVQNSMRCHLSWRTLQPYASVCMSKPGKGIKEFWSFSLCFYFIITRCHASVVDHTAYFLILLYCLAVLWVSLEQCGCWVHSTSEK